MTLRICVYKNCKNYINLKDRSLNKGITLFSFPKNPQRRLKWFEYGQVMPDLSPSMCFFCSKHFDKKFLAVNNRRTSLVGEAVPFPYVEPEIGENIQTDSSLDYYYEMNEDSHLVDNQDKQDLHVGSTTTMQDDGLNEYQDEFCTNKTKEKAKYKSNAENYILIEPSSSKAQTNKILTNNKTCNKSVDKSMQIINLKDINVGSVTNVDNLSEEIYEEHISIDLEEDDCTPILNKGMNFMHEPCKRKFEDNNFNKTPLSKAKVLKTSSILKIEKSQTTNNKAKPAAIKRETGDEELDLAQLLDPKHVTTFILKGEEYVQMPKEFYVREKMELAKKLQKMVRLVKGIQECVNKADV